MKTYPLNKGSINLPDKWEDLTLEQRIVAFRKLHLVENRKLSPLMFRLEMLGILTGYKPKADIFEWIIKEFWYRARRPFIIVSYLFRYGTIRAFAYWDIWKSHHKPKFPSRDIINQNLYRLSEKIEFAFTIENRTIVWNKYFYKNPVPDIQIGDKTFVGKKFIRDIAPFTDITAREYSDCYDLYSAYHVYSNPNQKNRCLDKMISILYPSSPTYDENMVSDHVDAIATIDPGIKFGVYMWFSGIVEYYHTHPDYSILFRSKQKEGDENKISIGMNETILMLEKNGYDTDKNINDFFDAQIKILKDYISNAKAYGVKDEEIVNKTGLSITDINRLV